MNAPANRRKVVIGGTYKDYRLWLRDSGLMDHRDAIHVGYEEERLLGLELKLEDIVRLGYGTPMFEHLLKTRIR